MKPFAAALSGFAWFVLAVVPGAAAEAPPLAHRPMGVPNGCFVETVALLDALGETPGAATWTRMLQWGAKEDEEVVAGHAVAVVESRGRLWSWDINFGWNPLAVPPAQREAAEVVAVPLTARYPGISPRFPSYRTDTAQQPDATPPSAGAASASDPRGAARLAAARLAKHRPVNLVEFSYLEGGVKKSSAAVVFLYHGRYCIYSPERGTVPYLRGQGTIEQDSRVMACLRRMFPGGISDYRSVR